MHLKLKIVVMLFETYIKSLHFILFHQIRDLILWPTLIWSSKLFLIQSLTEKQTMEIRKSFIHNVWKLLWNTSLLWVHENNWKLQMFKRRCYLFLLHRIKTSQNNSLKLKNINTAVKYLSVALLFLTVLVMVVSFVKDCVDWVVERGRLGEGEGGN